MSVDLDKKHRQLVALAKWGGLAAVVVALAPFYLVILHGIGALAALVATAAVGLTVANFLPYFGVKLANWKLKALKAEAAANPVETLENQYKEKQEALDKMRENIKEFGGVVQTLWDQIQEHDRAYPNSPSLFADKYEKMKALLALRAGKYKKSRANLKEFGEFLEEQRMNWKIYLTTVKGDKLANAGEDFQSQLMKSAAVASIQDKLNASFSELEVSLLDQDEPVAAAEKVADKAPALQLGAPVIDLDDDAEAVAVAVRRPRAA